MAQHFQAEVRKTRGYVDGYSHLDEWGQSFGFKELGRTVLNTGDGYDDAGTCKFNVIGSKKADQNLQRDALAANYSYSGCTHTYDCCGCLSVSADVRKTKRGVFSVLLRASRNY